MSRFIIGAVAALALLTIGIVRADDAKQSAYYPLKTGTTWTYKVKGEPDTITVKATTSEKDGTTVETSVNASKVESEKILVKDDGIYRTEFGQKKPDNPIKILKLPAKKDDSWDVDSKLDGVPLKWKFTTREEEVTVATGKYKAIAVECKEFDFGGKKMSATTWYVEKIGIVKTVMTVDGKTSEMELAKFEEGK